MLPIHTVLHPTDFSELSEDAFQAACRLARDHGARIIVLYVRAPALMVGPVGEAVPTVPDPVQTPDDVKSRLSALHVLDPALEVEYRVADGNPAAEIVRLAQAEGANLIVMGTHGRRGIGRLLLGSVAESVLRRAPCPVLTLRGPLVVGDAKPEAAAREPVAV
jgi:nucleotide-binding universal stress UspA family protein